MPFVAVDCSSWRKPSWKASSSAMFGGLTGAVTAKKGLFEEADRGTCFLDEIGNISPAIQAKLLRVLQEHEIKTVGGTETIKIDVRMVAPRPKPGRTGGEKKFREDLFYRLNVVSIHLPSSGTPEDIPC